MTPAYRNELKFLVNQAEYRQLQTGLHSLLGHDAHAGPDGGYHIRSLYFDDLYHTAYRQKMAGVEVRKNTGCASTTVPGSILPWNASTKTALISIKKRCP